MNEIEHVKSIMIVKAVYALKEIQRTLGRFKNQKRVINRVGEVAAQALHEIGLLAEKAGSKLQKNEKLDTIAF